MSDISDLLQQAYGSDSLSTSDVLGNVREPGLWEKYVKPLGSASLAQQEPNWFGRNIIGNPDLDKLMLLSAFLGPGPKTPPRSMAALEKAKAIAADETKGTPGQRTEKAWKAGGQYGGWDQLPTHAGETEWMRHIPTFDPKRPAIAAFEGASVPWDKRTWFGQPATEKAKGTLGELTNLNPALLKEAPELTDIPLSLKRGRDVTSQGGYNPPGWLRSERMMAAGYDNASLQEHLAHEIAHALANRQGWSSGTNPWYEKRPWLSSGMSGKYIDDFAHGDNAARRYKQVIGENVADLDARLEMNVPYKDYNAPRTFPLYEIIPQEQRGKGRPYSIERDIKGERPRDLPPSWQLEMKPEDMRNATPFWKAAAWNLPQEIAKPLLLTYGINQGAHWLFDKPAPPPPPRPGSLHDERGFIETYPPPRGTTGTW